MIMKQIRLFMILFTLFVASTVSVSSQGYYANCTPFIDWDNPSFNDGETLACENGFVPMSFSLDRHLTLHNVTTQEMSMGGNNYPTLWNLSDVRINFTSPGGAAFNFETANAIGELRINGLRINVLAQLGNGFTVNTNPGTFINSTIQNLTFSEPNTDPSNFLVDVNNEGSLTINGFHVENPGSQVNTYIHRRGNTPGLLIIANSTVNAPNDDFILIDQPSVDNSPQVIIINSDITTNFNTITSNDGLYQFISSTTDGVLFSDDTGTSTSTDLYRGIVLNSSFGNITSNNVTTARQWYVTVDVNDNQNTNVPGALVNALASNGSSLWVRSTNGNGLILLQPTTSEEYRNGVIVSTNPISFIATKDDFTPVNESIVVTDNEDVEISFLEQLLRALCGFQSSYENILIPMVGVIMLLVILGAFIPIDKDVKTKIMGYIIAITLIVGFIGVGIALLLPCS